MLHASAALTLVTGGSSVGRVRAVAHKAVALLDAPPPVVTEAAGAAAVARTPGAYAGCHLGLLLQVQAHTIDVQHPDAAEESTLLQCCSS